MAGNTVRRTCDVTGRTRPAQRQSGDHHRANSGIGRATARLFGREGAKSRLLRYQETISPRIDQLIKEKEGGEAVFATIDVTKQEDCDRMIKTALDSFGDVDILYNNAGAGIRKKLHEHTDEEWNFVINTNLNAMFRGARAVLPHFIRKKNGNIVTTASTFGLLASAEYPAIARPKPQLSISRARWRSTTVRSESASTVCVPAP